MSKKQVKSRNFSFGTIVALYKVIKKTLRNERRKTMERKLRNMSWTDFEELRKTAKTIIIPSGACEVYGPQNPLGADILVAKKLSEMLAERVNGIVAPCLEVGQSKSLTTFPGTIAISANTLKAVYSEIIDEFVAFGFYPFLHCEQSPANTQPLTEVLEDARIAHGIKYGQLVYGSIFPVVRTSLESGRRKNRMHTHQKLRRRFFFIFIRSLSPWKSSKYADQTGQMAGNHKNRSFTVSRQIQGFWETERLQLRKKEKSQWIQHWMQWKTLLRTIWKKNKRINRYFR